MPDISLIVFDVDGTLTRVRSVWEFLHRRLGVWESQGLPNLESYLAGKIDYETFARLDAAAYKDLSRAELMRYMYEIDVNPGVEECFQALKSMGLGVVLLSTGLDILLTRFREADLRFANELLFSGGVCTGGVKVNIPIDGKKRFMERLLAELQIDFSETIVVGDSTGDLEILQAATLGIAVNPSSERVRKVCEMTLTGDNLQDIPAYLAGRFSVKNVRHKMTGIDQAGFPEKYVGIGGNKCEKDV